MPRLSLRDRGRTRRFVGRPTPQSINRCTQADELAKDPLVAEAVLEFGDDLRSARAAADEWAEIKGLALHRESAGGEDDS
jgi:hypothetical protein